MDASFPVNKKELSERDICSKFMPPAIRRTGWDEQIQLREEVSFTKGRIIVRGRMVTAVA
jgi:type I restriction enzyme, R subunit